VPGFPSLIEARTLFSCLRDYPSRLRESNRYGRSRMLASVATLPVRAQPVAVDVTVTPVPGRDPGKPGMTVRVGFVQVSSYA
jgi:hypothetical protein